MSDSIFFLFNRRNLLSQKIYRETNINCSYVPYIKIIISKATVVKTVNQ